MTNQQPLARARSILVSGCSFTLDRWPTFIESDNTSVNNLAWPGAGNKYIADSVMYELSRQSYDSVLVMWSGLTRLDFLVEKDEYFETYPFKRQVGDYTYIMSGGELGSWTENSITNLLFSGLYKFNSFEHIAFASILEIIKLQSYLESKNIKYFFMSYINFWNKPSNWNSKNMDRGLNNYPGLTNLIQEIHFDNWVFLNDQKDGIYELAEQSNGFIADGFHPNKEIDYLWSELVKQRINS